MANEMSSGTTEYEFNPEQSRLIGNLARKMGMVGFVAMMFGVLQMVNGIVSFFSTMNPDKFVAAAKEAGLSDEMLQRLQHGLTSGGWLSPLTISSIAFALTGLFVFLIGLWTQQSAVGFAGVAATQGQDIRRLMGALGALHKKYTLMATILWIAALSALISLLFSLFQMWSGKA